MEQQGPAAVAPEAVQTQQSFLPGCSPKLAGPLESTRILPEACLHLPPAPPFLPRVGHAARPSVVGTLPERPPCWATVSPRTAIPLQREHPASLLQPGGDIIPLEARVPPGSAAYSGGKPPQSMRCRDFPRRLRLRGAFGVRLLAGALRQRTAAADLLPHPYLPGPFHTQPDSLLARGRCPFEGPVPPPARW